MCSLLERNAEQNTARISVLLMLVFSEREKKKQKHEAVVSCVEDAEQ